MNFLIALMDISSRMHGTLIAASLSDLFDGSILNSINRIETGNVNNNSGPELKQCI